MQFVVTMTVTFNSYDDAERAANELYRQTKLNGMVGITRPTIKPVGNT